MEGEVAQEFYAPQLEGGYWQEKPADLYLRLFRTSANKQLLPLLTIAELLDRLFQEAAGWGDCGYKSLKQTWKRNAFSVKGQCWNDLPLKWMDERQGRMHSYMLKESKGENSRI